jgi:kynurenine formamidase
MSSPWIDLTAPISAETPVYPGDPVVHFDVLEAGEAVECNGELLRPPIIRHMHMSSHTGTHIDAPAHITAGAKTVDDISLDTLVGGAAIIFLPDCEKITGKLLAPVLLKIASTSTTITRMLLLTDFSTAPTPWYRQPFPSSFPHLTADAAQLLVQNQFQFVGIDSPSIDAIDAESLPVHRTILGSGAVVLEGIDATPLQVSALQSKHLRRSSEVLPGTIQHAGLDWELITLGDIDDGSRHSSAVALAIVELVALPMKIQQGDGAPTRVIVRSRPLQATA